MTGKRAAALGELAVTAGVGPPEDGPASQGRLRVPTMQERALIFLRATQGKDDFSGAEHAAARELILEAMAAEVVSRSDPSVSRRPDAPAMPVRSEGDDHVQTRFELERAEPAFHAEVALLGDVRYARAMVEVPEPILSMSPSRLAREDADLLMEFANVQSASQPPRRTRAILRKCALAVAIIAVVGLSLLGAITLARMSLDWLHAFAGG
jgi:hypothetical protein